MCGIAGMQGRVDRALLERMQASIRHRGPDSEGLYAAPERGIGLAHTRLSILDLSPQGAQPMASDCGGVHIVYNGETYNSPALRDELESDGVTFRGHPRGWDPREPREWCVNSTGSQGLSEAPRGPGSDVEKVRE